MFLFKFKQAGKHIIHTGDFRASSDLVNDQMLRGISIDTVHLDTT